MPKINHIARSTLAVLKFKNGAVAGVCVMVDVSETGWVGASGFRPQ